MTAWYDVFTDSLARFSSVGFFDVLDIAIVSVIFYYIYRFVRDRRAGKLAVGILLVFVAMMVSNLLGMQVMSFLIGNIVQVGMIGVVILFQSELRTFLEKVGGPSIITRRKKDKKAMSQAMRCIDAVVEAVAELSTEKTGALIIFERSTKLGDVIKTGTLIDALPGAYMIKNIFFNKAPMHDGALIIRGNRLYSAGCFLPLSSNPEIIKDLGTRHRAGIGMSELSDAVVVIVSEETGIVSVALDGVLTRDYDSARLRKLLIRQLLSEENTHAEGGESGENVENDTNRVKNTKKPKNTNNGKAEKNKKNEKNDKGGKNDRNEKIKTDRQKQNDRKKAKEQKAPIEKNGKNDKNGSKNGKNNAFAQGTSRAASTNASVTTNADMPKNESAPTNGRTPTNGGTSEKERRSEREHKAPDRQNTDRSLHEERTGAREEPKENGGNV